MSAPIFHIPNPMQVPRVEQSSPEPWQGTGTTLVLRLPFITVRGRVDKMGNSAELPIYNIALLP